MTKDEALTLALEALLEMSPSGPTGSEIWHKQMNAIRVASEALAQPERPWVGLTNEDYKSLALTVAVNKHQCQSIEAKLKEKNT